MGAIISLFLLAIFVWTDSMIKLSIVVDHVRLIKINGKIDNNCNFSGFTLS